MKTSTWQQQDVPGLRKDSHKLAILKVVLLVKGREKQVGLGEWSMLGWNVLFISVKPRDLQSGEGPAR